MESNPEEIRLNVRGTEVFIPPQVLPMIEGSSLEAFISGRHSVETKDGLPFLDRDPKLFQQMIKIILSTSIESEVTQDISEEFNFWCIDANLILDRRVLDVHVHQETVHLRFGQWIGALLLDRVLCRHDHE